ncbi:MAG: GntR family transcriptional regulator [Blautia sp.]|nr:GntR family transcriptional regulator [Blautia sp.]
MEWVFKNGIPIYQQIVETIKLGIARGEYAPGSKLASVRELALEAGVNPNTMQRALSELERDGLLHTERTQGRYVTEEETLLTALRHSLGETYIEEMFRGLGSLGLTREEILEAVKEYGSSHRGEK